MIAGRSSGLDCWWQGLWFLSSIWLFVMPASGTALEPAFCACKVHIFRRRVCLWLSKMLIGSLCCSGSSQLLSRYLCLSMDLCVILSVPIRRHASYQNQQADTPINERSATTQKKKKGLQWAPTASMEWTETVNLLCLRAFQYWVERWGEDKGFYSSSLFSLLSARG